MLNNKNLENISDRPVFQLPSASPTTNWTLKQALEMEMKIMQNRPHNPKMGKKDDCHICLV